MEEALALVVVCEGGHKVQGYDAVKAFLCCGCLEVLAEGGVCDLGHAAALARSEVLAVVAVCVCVFLRK